MEYILGIIAAIILVIFALRYGYIIFCCAFNIYSFTLFGEYYWIIGAAIILLLYYLYKKGFELFYYLLILFFILNVFSIIVSIFKSDFILIPIFILNIYVLYNFYQEYGVIKLKEYFMYHYGMTYEEALNEIKFEKFVEWAVRAMLGDIINVWGFLLKPLTDEFGHKIFGSTHIRKGVALVKAYEEEISKYPKYALFGYLAIIIIYHFSEIPYSFQMSYTFIVYYIIGIF